MKCHYHEDRESANNCAICGKPICSECGMEIGGNILCKECVNALISDNLSQKVTQTQNYESPEEIERPEFSQSAPAGYKEAPNVHSQGAIYQESPSTFANEGTQYYTEENLENKYEKYLDDLYYDEPEKHEYSLKEQLARDKDLESIAPVHEVYEEYMPSNSYNEWAPENDRMNSSIRRTNFHRIPSRQRSEPYTAVDIILTIILVILILLVIFYIIYLFVLSSSYPTFLDALFGLFTDPGKLLGSLFAKPS